MNTFFDEGIHSTKQEGRTNDCTMVENSNMSAVRRRVLDFSTAGGGSTEETEHPRHLRR